VCVWRVDPAPGIPPPWISFVIHSVYLTDIWQIRRQRHLSCSRLFALSGRKAGVFTEDRENAMDIYDISIGMPFTSSFYYNMISLKVQNKISYCKINYKDVLKY